MSSYESLSESEKNTLRKLQSKAKRIQRQNKAFWEWVDDNRDEVLAHLGVQPPKKKGGTTKCKTTEKL